ncbi:MAG: hypothetical protein JWM75_1186 [Sphingomonas bacterium]|nr:hypothetical protein [Sphingomonas bacterium]
MHGSDERVLDHIAHHLAELANGITSATNQLAKLRPFNSQDTQQRKLVWATGTYKLRRIREDIFGATMFADPRWDILLDLYRAHLEGRQIQVSSACIGSHVPSTTALRHIHELEKAGHLVREESSSDTRKAYISLSPPTIERMDALFHRSEEWLRRNSSVGQEQG